MVLPPGATLGTAVVIANNKGFRGGPPVARDQRHSIWKRRGKPLAFKMGVSVPLYLYLWDDSRQTWVASRLMQHLAPAFAALCLSIFAANQICSEPES